MKGRKFWNVRRGSAVAVCHRRASSKPQGEAGGRSGEYFRGLRVLKVRADEMGLYRSIAQPRMHAGMFRGEGNCVRVCSLTYFVFRGESVALVK